MLCFGACADASAAPLFIYVEPAPLASRGAALSTATRAGGGVCYDTATLLPSVLPLAAAVDADGCQSDVILSPLSTLLLLGGPLGLTQDIIKVRQGLMQ